MASVNTIAFQSPQFSVLSESQMKDLHLAALEVLRNTGLRFYHKGAVEMLKEAGAFVSDGNLVKIPARMVEEAISTVPGRFRMTGRPFSRSGLRPVRRIWSFRSPLVS